jgi:signal transduction histidine kinase
MLRRPRREVHRLSSLMEDLLEYGKPMPATLIEGPLEDVLDLAIAHSAALATAAGVTIERTVERGAWEMALNRGRLAQVFENLLANAIQHSPRGAVVELTTRGCAAARPGARRVADQGPGFDRDLPRVFELLFCGGAAGRGWAIASRIVDEGGRSTLSTVSRPVPS